MLVAGGGGGAGGGNCGNPDSGGDGGGVSGEAGVAEPVRAWRSVGGGGGTQTDGGSATSPATEGDFGVGGNGGDTRRRRRRRRLVRRRRRLDPAGGGGGSGHGPEGTVFQTGVHSGDGLVTVTYTVPTATIADLIDSVEALELPKGIENSLLTKLNNAQRNLDRDDLSGACDKLGAFIGQVERQSGKKIDAADANELIAEAEAVRAGVPCA